MESDFPLAEIVQACRNGRLNAVTINLQPLLPVHTETLTAKQAPRFLPGTPCLCHDTCTLNIIHLKHIDADLEISATKALGASAVNVTRALSSGSIIACKS